MKNKDKNKPTFQIKKLVQTIISQGSIINSLKKQVSYFENIFSLGQVKFDFGFKIKAISFTITWPIAKVKFLFNEKKIIIEQRNEPQKFTVRFTLYGDIHIDKDGNKYIYYYENIYDNPLKFQ